jgi:RimJ/RimL family protein N-acetyltransferase
VADSRPTITFRTLRPADFPILLGWLQRPHVKQWWDDGDDTLDKVAEHYLRDSQNTKRFMLQLEGEDRGYFQYHRFDSGRHSGHISTDQFLANADDLSKGIGSTCLLAFIDMITSVEAPEVISVDPHPANRRAIGCYEKCGFNPQPAKSSATILYMIKRCQEDSD